MNHEHAAARCADCNVSLGKQPQPGLPGITRPEYCPGCKTKRRTKMMLDALPTEDDREWSQLTDFETEFLPSLRRQFAQKGTVSERQYEVLERTWKRL